VALVYDAPVRGVGALTDRVCLRDLSHKQLVDAGEGCKSALQHLRVLVPADCLTLVTATKRLELGRAEVFADVDSRGVTVRAADRERYRSAWSS